MAHLLPHTNAYDPALRWSEQPERCVLILDNARVHEELSLAVFQAAGVLVRRLLPHSPAFNPIQDVFSVGSSDCAETSLRSSSTIGDFEASSASDMFTNITLAVCNWALVRTEKGFRKP